jgi:hypothetical protein
MGNDGVTVSGSTRLNIAGQNIDVTASYSSSGELSVTGGTTVNVPGVRDVDLEVFMDGNTFGVKGITCYYVKVFGNIALTVGVDSNKELYLEGSRGGASVRVSSMGDVTLSYGGTSVEVNKDFIVGIFNGKVTTEASAGAGGAVNVNGVRVGINAGGKLNAGVDSSGKIHLESI